MPEWHNAISKTPEEEGRYLVALKRTAPETFGGNTTTIRILRYTSNNGFHLPVHFPAWINDVLKEEVTHWMPLPNLPGEVE